MRPLRVRALSFHPIPASFTPTVPNCYWVPWFVPQPYQRSYALYEVSVRQAGCFPTASFRSHFTMDTLAWGYMIPTIRTHLGDLHPLNSAHDGRTASSARDAPTGLAVFLPRIEAGRYAPLDSRFTLHTFIMWQEVIVILIGLAAFGCAGWRCYRFFKGRGAPSCGCCSGCDAADALKAPGRTCCPTKPVDSSTNDRRRPRSSGSTSRACCNP